MNGTRYVVPLRNDRWKRTHERGERLSAERTLVVAAHVVPGKKPGTQHGTLARREQRHHRFHGDEQRRFRRLVGRHRTYVRIGRICFLCGVRTRSWPIRRFLRSTRARRGGGPTGKSISPPGPRRACGCGATRRRASRRPHRSATTKTVGFVIRGRAELHLDGTIVALAEGDSWTVPRGASHTYKILEAFTAIEATTPPA